MEIGSFKGRSTVMLAKVASHYSLGPIVAIDPHNSPILLDHHANPEASSYQDFLDSMKAPRKIWTDSFLTWSPMA